MKNFKNINILVVDDSPDALEMVSRKLKNKGFNVYKATDVGAALNILEHETINLVITDYKMPKISGLELIKHIRSNFRHLIVIMITGYPTIDGAVEAVKLGAEEYLTKPFTDQELYDAVEKALHKIATKQMIYLDKQTPNSYGIIGESECIKDVFRSIEKSIAISATVLIYGESGTGKELVARAIHYNSSRASAPFVPVNCGAIPESLLESELFGFVKGAFTGATETRAGFFIVADGGTIFLDEIGETSLSMQVKLLRVLQDKQISMVGAKQLRKVDIRIITATNKSLQSLVSQGHFREDLFYRLNVINIQIPPLRERGDDIIILSNHFLDKYSQEIGKNTPTLSENAMNALKRYSWPGNVRELENTMQRLVVMTDHNLIESPDLPEAMRFCVQKDKGIDRSLHEVEQEHIRNVLSYTQGNKTRAAQILGIDRKTLRNKLDQKK